VFIRRGATWICSSWTFSIIYEEMFSVSQNLEIKIAEKGDRELIDKKLNEKIFSNWSWISKVLDLSLCCSVCGWLDRLISLSTNLIIKEKFIKFIDSDLLVFNNKCRCKFRWKKDYIYNYLTTGCICVLSPRWRRIWMIFCLLICSIDEETKKYTYAYYSF